MTKLPRTGNSPLRKDLCREETTSGEGSGEVTKTCRGSSKHKRMTNALCVIIPLRKSCREQTARLKCSSREKTMSGEGPSGEVRGPLNTRRQRRSCMKLCGGTDSHHHFDMGDDGKRLLPSIYIYFCMYIDEHKLRNFLLDMNDHMHALWNFPVIY